MSRSLLLLPLVVLACGALRPVVADLPPEATPAHRCLAVLEDYLLFSRDVNQYLVLPSVSLEEATAIDRVLDEADRHAARLRVCAEEGGVESAGFDAAVAGLQVARGLVCAQAPDVEGC